MRVSLNTSEPKGEQVHALISSMGKTTISATAHLRRLRRTGRSACPGGWAGPEVRKRETDRKAETGIGRQTPTDSNLERMAPFNDTYTQTHTRSTHPQRHILWAPCHTLTSKDTHESGPLHQHTSRACTSPGKGFLIWTKWPEFVSKSGWVEL